MLVFSKRTLHVSDPRPPLLAARGLDPGSRVALVWRVVVKDARGRLPVWGGHFLAQRYVNLSYSVADEVRVDRVAGIGRHELLRREVS